MKNEMIKLSELEAYLGYNDSKLRSLKTWCQQNKVPVLRLGTIDYVHESMFNIAFNRKMHRAINSMGLDADGITNAIDNDDKVQLAELMYAPTHSTAKKKFKAKKEEESIETFFNNYKNQAS